MVIQVNQSFKIKEGDEVLVGRVGDIKTVDDKWSKHSFFQSLMADKKVIAYIDNAVQNEEQNAAKAKKAEAEKAQKIQKQVAIEQAIEAARIEVEQIAKVQGLDEVKKNELFEAKKKAAIEKINKNS